MRKPPSVKPEVFQAIQTIDIASLQKFPLDVIRPILPCLVRTALCAPVDKSSKWSTVRKDVLKILVGIEDVNNIVALLSIDFHALEQDVKKEQQLRSKAGSSQVDSVLVSQLQNGLALEFEHSDPARRIRLLLCEILHVQAQIKDNKTDFSGKQWELFDSDVYLEEVSDVLCIACSELPGLLHTNDLAESLMHVPNGPWLLCRQVANSPDCFKDVCESVVRHGDKQDEDSVAGRKRMDLLYALCAMNPHEALFVRALCVQNCTMAGLAVGLTLKCHPGSDTTLKASTSEADQSAGSFAATHQSADDLVCFVSGLLLGNNLEVKNWFSQFVKQGQRRDRQTHTSILHLMRQELCRQLSALLPASNDSIASSHIIQAAAFIRLYCALKGIATLKYIDEEMKLLLRLVTMRPPISASGARFVSLALCMLIACPYIIGNAEQEKQVADWIRWLIASEKLFQSSDGKNSSFGEMLFLIAIHFHGNHMHAISELVCATLGMKCPVKANSLARIRQIFTQEIFTEQVITSHAVTVPVTEGLSANMDGYLPIHCIYQLLKSRAFSKYKVPIKEWIYRQISVCSYPLHPLLPSLLEAYVNSMLVKTAKTDYTHQPIDTKDIATLFSDLPSLFKSDHRSKKEINLTPQLCMLYYILLFEDTMDTQRKALALSGRSVDSYPSHLLSQVPINYLIQQAQKRQDLYGGLFAALLKLLVQQFPHLCLIEDWLDETASPAKGDSIFTKIHTGVKCSVEHFRTALDTLESTPTGLLDILHRLCEMPEQELSPFIEDVVGCLPRVLVHSVPRAVVDAVKKVWFKIHSLMPRRVRLSTVNVLRPHRKTGFKFSTYSETDLTVDPLIVLRCDERVFSCAPILEILLRVLSAYTLACRVHMERHIHSNPVLDGNQQTDQNRQELKAALLAAQESAVIQILLEYCLPDRANTQASDGMMNTLQEVRSVICSYIHQCFISDPNLAKLIHFQGYSSALLPVTVKGVPSMHICLDYIPEMLSQPQLDKQIFAIKLTSHLCCQFALPKALSIAKLCINVMFGMVGALEVQHRVEFFSETVPCLVKVCEAFSPLCEDVTSLLIQLGRVCLSHLSHSSNVPHTGIFEGKCYQEVKPKLDDVDDSIPSAKRLKQFHSVHPTYHKLYKIIQGTFSAIVTKSVATKDLY